MTYKNYALIENLKECNFGEFEYKTYEDLKNFPEYKKWIDSNGMSAFPKGESGIDFRKRSIEGFNELIKNALNKNYNKIAIICHGGTIMSIMEAYEESKKSFYDWQIKNSQGFITEFSNLNNKYHLKVISKIL